MIYYKFYKENEYCRIFLNDFLISFSYISFIKKALYDKTTMILNNDINYFSCTDKFQKNEIIEMKKLYLLDKAEFKYYNAEFKYYSESYFVIEGIKELSYKCEITKDQFYGIL